MDALLFVSLKGDKVTFENAIGTECQLDLSALSFYLTVMLQPMQDDVHHEVDGDKVE